MKIAMFTNTYTPHVGGVANSVRRFTEQLRERGHRVLVVAPVFPDQPEDEEAVHRVPAIQNFNGSDFSVALPIKPDLDARLRDFGPDLLHAHHPYLLGDTALRAEAELGTALVFTHHTFYEHYTHYTPIDGEVFRQFVVELSTRYANLSDRVIAPSESVAAILAERGVTTPIEPIPTGVDCARFASGDGAAVRREAGIPPEAHVVGHLGRLAEEKNLAFLGDAVADYLGEREDAWFLVVGDGDFRDGLETRLRDRGVGDRTVFAGKRTGADVVDAYHAMDVFAFASKSETQGMVLVEAFASGVPVVALDAPGARDVVRDGENGRLVETESREAFVAALQSLEPPRLEALAEGAQASAGRWSLTRSADRLEALYKAVLGETRAGTDREASEWQTLQRRLEREWVLWSNRAAALGDALTAPGGPSPS
ncbi:MAG: glycosyltransferase [Planctomycetota bacterium]